MDFQKEFKEVNLNYIFKKKKELGFKKFNWNPYKIK